MEGKLALESVLASPYPLRSLLVLRRRLNLLDELRLPAGGGRLCGRPGRDGRRHRVQRPPWVARRGRTVAPGTA